MRITTIIVVTGEGDYNFLTQLQLDTDFHHDGV